MLALEHSIAFVSEQLINLILSGVMIESHLVAGAQKISPGKNGHIKTNMTRPLVRLSVEGEKRKHMQKETNRQADTLTHTHTRTERERERERESPHTLSARSALFFCDCLLLSFGLVGCREASDVWPEHHRRVRCLGHH